MRVSKTDSKYNTGYFYDYSINESLSDLVKGTLIYGTIKYKLDNGGVYALVISECDLDSLSTNVSPEGDLIYLSEDTPNIDNIIKAVTNNKEYNQVKIINGKLHYAFLLKSFMRSGLVSYYKLLSSVPHSIIEEQLEKDFPNRRAYTEGIFRLDFKSELSMSWAETFSENGIYIETASYNLHPREGEEINYVTNGSITSIDVEYDYGAQITTGCTSYILINTYSLGIRKISPLDTVSTHIGCLGIPRRFNLNMLVEAIKEGAYNKAQTTVSIIAMLASLYLYENPEKLIEYYKSIALETDYITDVVSIYLEKLSKDGITHSEEAIEVLLEDFKENDFEISIDNLLYF